MTDYESMWKELKDWVTINVDGLEGNTEINRIMDKYDAPRDLSVGNFVASNKDGTVSKTQ